MKEAIRNNRGKQKINLRLCINFSWIFPKVRIIQEIKFLIINYSKQYIQPQYRISSAQTCFQNLKKKFFLSQSSTLSNFRQRS